MRNDITEDLGIQMNEMPNSMIEDNIASGEFFDIQRGGHSGPDYMSLHTVINDEIYQFYRVDFVWYCKQ